MSIDHPMKSQNSSPKPRTTYKNIMVALRGSKGVMLKVLIALPSYSQKRIVILNLAIARRSSAVVSDRLLMKRLVEQSKMDASDIDTASSAKPTSLTREVVARFDNNFTVFCTQP